MKKLLSAIFAFFVILAVSFFTYAPLLNSGFFSIHDYQHIVRLFELDKSLMVGQFPVRWVEGLGFGYGYPLFNFYPPFVYYLGEVIHLIGFGFIDSIKVVWFIALVGSGLTMYLFAEEIYGKFGGFISAVAYIYASYHAIDAYVRGALAELFSFVWLPLILLSVYKKKPILAGIFLGLLMITHNLIFLPFFGFFVVWAIFFDRKSLFLAPLVAFGLTAFFWLPSLYEKQFTLVDQLLIKNLASYKIHFVCLSQFWNSPWGFGGSGQGCFDGISFMIGRIYLFLVVIGLIVGVWKRFRSLLVAFLLFLFAGFMATNYSKFVWDLIPQLWYLQFPWRFIEFMVLFSSLLAGSFVIIFSNKIIKIILGLLLVGLLVFINAKYFRPQYYNFNENDYTATSDTQVKWNVSQSSFEYLPKGMQTYYDSKDDLKVSVTQSTVANEKYQIVFGGLRVRQIVFRPDFLSLSGMSSEGAVIRFSVVNFPGWTATIDSTPISINDKNPLKLIEVIFPKGDHILTISFKNTPARLLGNIISLVSILLVGRLLIYAKRRGKK